MVLWPCRFFPLPTPLFTGYIDKRLKIIEYTQFFKILIYRCLHTMYILIPKRCQPAHSIL
nr:MAG TPA: hypothetical protein [Crassvirales sp.]